jgi:hypothetical protein
MKKLLALLSLTAFLAVAVNAQTQTTPAPKKETVAKSESKPASCCMKANASCCKNSSSATSAKACTPQQKADCAKAGSMKECSGHAGAAGHSKSEAKVEGEKGTAESK